MCDLRLQVNMLNLTEIFAGSVTHPERMLSSIMTLGSVLVVGFVLKILCDVLQCVSSKKKCQFNYVKNLYQ